MNENERIKAVQRADKISLDSRAAMIVEYDNNGDLHVATYGQTLGIFYMKRNLKNLLENE